MNYSKYIVIKNFGSLKKGDILTWSEDENQYVFVEEHDGDNGYSSLRVTLSESMVNLYFKEGFLDPYVEEEENEESEESKKLANLKQLISSLKNTYEQRNKNVQKKYNAGKLPTCQKVEHDTVHFNLMKLLNKFESIINE